MEPASPSAATALHCLQSHTLLLQLTKIVLRLFFDIALCRLDAFHAVPQ